MFDSADHNIATKYLINKNPVNIDISNLNPDPKTKIVAIDYNMNYTSFVSKSNKYSNSPILLLNIPNLFNSYQFNPDLLYSNYFSNIN